MQRIFTYPITSEDAGKDIHSFLREKGYSRHILASMKPDREAILVNGVHELLRYELQVGDILTTRVTDPESSENIKPAPVPFSVIYEDEDILVIDKPSNTAIHPAISHPANTLANGVVWYYQQKGIPFVFRCINRLDRDTTGLLIVAKNLVSACVLEQDLRSRNIHRTYLALADGILDESGTINLPIARKEGSLIERCVDMENGDRAVTHYRTLRYGSILNREAELPADSFLPPAADANTASGMHGSTPASGSGMSQGAANLQKHGAAFSTVQLQLETGRTHQIRVHLAYLGHPLLGDTLYHPDFLRKPEDPPAPDVCIGRQALHSWKLEFRHPITRELLQFEAPIPPDMQKLLDGDI